MFLGPAASRPALLIYVVMNESSTTFTHLESLDAGIVKVWRLKTGLWLGVLVLAVLVVDVIQFFDNEKWLPFGVLPAVLLLVGLAITYWIPALRYQYWRYSLQESELVLIRGIFNRVHTIVPLRRIQHLDVSQDIFEREYDLGKLIVHTAGTRSSTVFLPGLAIEKAEKLRDDMKKVITDEAL